MYETTDGKQLWKGRDKSEKSININCLEVTQMLKIAISGKDEKPISTAFIS